MQKRPPPASPDSRPGPQPKNRLTGKDARPPKASAGRIRKEKAESAADGSANGGPVWYRIRELSAPASEKQPDARRCLARFLRLPEAKIGECRIIRQSLDARNRRHPQWKLAVEFSYPDELRHPRLTRIDAVGDAAGFQEAPPWSGPRVAVVGSGPAGLSAALGLARKGYRVTVFEQGKKVGERFRDIRRFIKGGLFHPTSNILFGEGGAGTFSDGKLTSRTRTDHTRAFLEEWVACGADPSILYLHHPHIGTDKLQFLVTRMRERAEAAGTEFRFEAAVRGLLVEDGRCAGVELETGPERFDAVVLAVGLSAFPLFRRLLDQGVPMEAKGFAVGVRIEHPQALINGRQAPPGEAPPTGAAEYLLTWQGEGRAAYSFCMCPGGVVVPCADADGALFTNGMSYSNRASAFANSAVVAPVKPEALDPSAGVLAGLAYQEDLERRAYALGGGEFGFPAQTPQAFIDNRLDEGPFPRTSFQRPLRWANLRDLFDAEVGSALADGLKDFDRKIPGFIAQGLLIGPESRTSCPLRIPRDPRSLEAIAFPGLYPIGEGAGYSGGIVSSGGDGFRLAAAVGAWKRAEA